MPRESKREHNRHSESGARLAFALTFVAASVLVVSGAFAIHPELEVADRAESMIREKISEARPRAVRRARALYRVSRAADSQNLLAAEHRECAAMLSNLRWMLERDLIPLRALETELAKVSREKGEISLLERPESVGPPPRPMLRPAAGSTLLVPFGERRVSRLRLTARGVTWKVSAGADVRAPTDATVVFSGVAGGGGVIVLETGNEWLVLSPVTEGSAVGTEVRRGDRLGVTSGGQLALERRIVSDRGGTPVNPGNFVDR